MMIGKNIKKNVIKQNRIMKTKGQVNNTQAFVKTIQ